MNLRNFIEEVKKKNLFDNKMKNIVDYKKSFSINKI